MRILLVSKQTKIEPLGLMYLASIAKHAGHEAQIVDLFNAGNTALEWKPDIIGYSVMTGDQNTFLALNGELKRHLHFKAIVGGAHPTFFPEDFESDGDIDGICRGEGEPYFANLLGVYYPDKLFPDRTDFPMRRIRHFIASRGCPFNCSYCYNEQWAKFAHGKRVRTSPVDHVIEDIANANAEFVYFQDDCFGLDIDWLKEFANKYNGTPYHCHVRPNLVTDERALWLKISGCRSVHIAVECASDNLRNSVLCRKLSDKDIITAIDRLKHRNIGVMTQNIIGIPTGTIEDDLDTLKFNIDCKPDYAWVSIYQPYPGTKLGDWCKENGYYKGDYKDISPSFFDTSHLDISEEYKERLRVLQKVFALCVETETVPKPEELTTDNLPSLVYNAMRKLGDNRLFGFTP